MPTRGNGGKQNGKKKKPLARKEKEKIKKLTFFQR